MKYAYRLETRRIQEKDFPYQNQDISSAARVVEFCRTLEEMDVEKLIALYLNGRNQLIGMQFFPGTINCAVVYPREIVKHAILSGACCSIVLVHNHPSGSLQFSQADISLTKKVKEACALIDVSLLDHVLIGQGQTSMREEGLI